MQKLILALLFVLASSAIAHAQAAQTATFAVTWTDNSGNNPAVADQEDGFRIERRLGQTGTFALVGSVGPNVVKFVDTILNDLGNVQYCYRVQAFNKTGSSAFSNIACATSPTINVAPGAPGNVSVTVTVTVTVP